MTLRRMLFISGIAIVSVSCGAQSDSGDLSTRGRQDEVSVSARVAPALAWTGERLFVYGGTVPLDPSESVPPERLNDAYLIDTETGTAEQLPDPPFEHPLGVSAAAAGSEDWVTLVGTVCAEERRDSYSGECEPGDYAAAALDLAERTWRTVDLPEELAIVRNGERDTLGTDSSGDAIFVLGPMDPLGAVDQQSYWRFSPGEATWEELPRSGVRADDECLAGDRIVVATSSAITDGEQAAGPDAQLPGGGGESYVEPSLHILDLSSESPTWSESASTDVGDLVNPPSVACATDAALIHDGTGAQATVYQPLSADGQWSEIVDRPAESNHQTIVWTGSQFLFIDSTPPEIAGDGPSLSYDPVTSTWEELSVEFQIGTSPVWTGDAVVSWSVGAEGGALLVNDDLGS